MNNSLTAYNPNHIRVIANNFAQKYAGLTESHVYWIAKELNIYPDAVCALKKKTAYRSKMGKINSDNVDFVTNGKMNDKGVENIENYLKNEGYKTKKDYQEDIMKQNTNIWEQADLIALMKKDYDKAVAERDEANAEAEEYYQLVDKYEQVIEELKDKLLIAEKENTSLKEEKIELGKMQVKTVDFDKEIDNLQKRIGQYNAEINSYTSAVNELRKDVSALQVSVNQLQEKKKKLEGVISDLVGCSKRLMNMK